jgi:acetolactate synthase regulatory subunit
MKPADISLLHLKLTVRQSVTVMPRCLQILSRRGYIVNKLLTEPIDDTSAVIRLSVIGQQRWHTAIPHLLSRIVEVENVTVEEAVHE